MRSRSRDAIASAKVSRVAMASPQPRHFHFAPQKRGKRSTERCGGLHLLPGKSGRELHPLPGTAAAFMTKAAHLSVLHDRIDGSHHPTRPGPALPGITRCKREFCTPSPAPVQRAPRSPNTCRTGMMPRPPANRSDWPLPAEPAPAPSKAVAADDVPHDERVKPHMTLSGTFVNIEETRFSWAAGTFVSVAWLIGAPLCPSAFPPLRLRSAT